MNQLPIRPVHKSLSRPQMIQGGERELILFSYLIGVGTGLVCVRGYGVLPGLLIGAVLTIGLLFIARRMGAADPIMSKVIKRHYKYQAEYPAHARIHAMTPQVHDFK
ncbi:VirB3 family type IV secretion system protein [Caballeronia sp. LP003]|jgi:type IV secretion system protein TrbD|uniref:VirB3 family type IV secretion system protein n=1 Tax=Caballeronia sp. LP003 TaxID=3038551 RepID=UPI002865356C|nr:VirB3 family type IV secretion system protein [Caballeronia sp. LP003]MDR5791726.1 VirB3 family type IV secretion system protein [Caballeronia sp. LP003]